jgi:three-Cys-motif partner protein
VTAKSTDAHFAEYPANTRIKHEILTRYLKAYLSALSQVADAFHYIDGFAGRGSYGGTNPGSPIRALEILAQQKLPFCTSFIEASPDDAENLRRTIGRHAKANQEMESPLVLTGEFADYIESVLSRPSLARYRRCATFAFVDPCRAKGVRQVDLKRILDKQFGECLVFWNYDGVNRWLGAVNVDRANSDGLRDLFGDSERLANARSISSAANGPKEKEQELLSLFLDALRAHSGATHLLPFRFNAPEAERTSHYLIHCSRHGLAFKLMKDVMSSLSSSGRPGDFAFLGQGDIGTQADMFRPLPETLAAQEIIEELRKGPRHVRLFRSVWVERPNDFLSDKDYREILLGLERDGVIEVVDEKGKVIPAAKRLRNGVPSLGEGRYVRLSRD